ncbi:MAG TPA: lytic murein transglycosylase [Jatrophihabitantaceae bacterium]|nr:lytic murein transglycosylase [Jatrophihabitantaceae bacterium]
MLEREELFGHPDDSPILAPGIAAMLRRHPRRVRGAAVGSMFSGIILFVIASLAANAGADPARNTAAQKAAAGLPGSAAIPYETFTGLPEPFATTTPAAPKHVKKPAPADAAAISGLAANGIPAVVLNAYRVAAARLASAQPACGIDWALLAGIGRVESDHGRFAGAVVHADGVSTPRIIGIPLDGHGTALIRDTDGGRLDGDTVYDRAVGPMQFIPSTWALYGTDGDGDGVANPFDVNDAALTAARYLCAAGGDLRTHAGQVAAVLAYNHSDEYVAQVLALADAYRRGIPVTGIPVGNTSGALPPLSGGPVPPANPGAPLSDSAKTSMKTSTKAAPKPSSSTSPAAGGTSTSAGSGGGSSGGASGSTSTSAPVVIPSPSPSGTKVCLIWDLLNPGRCAVWKN